LNQRRFQARTRPSFEALAADLHRRQRESSGQSPAPERDRRHTVSGTIVRILKRDDPSSKGESRQLRAAWQAPRTAVTSEPAPKWWIKVRGNPATFIVTAAEYPDIVFLREGDHVVVEYLADGDPGRPKPGERIKIERLTCTTLDGGCGSTC
jgi:hypothetical protein